VDPCCKSCQEPLEKYFSVDVKHGFCGATRINSSKEGTDKIYDKKLTKADSDTVTHGIPGLLAVTLNLNSPEPEVEVEVASTFYCILHCRTLLQKL